MGASDDDERSKEGDMANEQTVEAGVDCPACPDCDGPMTRRVSSKTSQPFWGCNRYPQCEGLIDIVEPRLPKPFVDDFRKTAALKLLCTMLNNPDIHKGFWDRYLVDRSECRLAVDIADDLVKELERIK